MAAELPLLSAVIARLPDPEIHLAAYGGIVFPVALIVEAPIIMLLAASTALCSHWQAYLRVRKFMMITGGALTVLHLLIALTPLYDFVAGTLINAPESIREPGRLGFLIMTPWTWAIAHRRFHQGVLIRAGRSRDVGIGTFVRLSAVGLFMLIGTKVFSFSGIVLATGGVISGVVSEAAFVRWRVSAPLRKLKRSRKKSEPLQWPEFFRFYTPLALTPFLELSLQVITASALSRMPLKLESLAIWPVMHGLLFIFKSMGIAFNEVVVATLEKPNGREATHQFCVRLSGGLLVVMALLSFSPLGTVWFAGIAGLGDELARIASGALCLAMFNPALTAWCNWFQGNLVHHRKTTYVTEALGVFLVVCASLLYGFVSWGGLTGLHAGLFSLAVAAAAQALWLRRRVAQINARAA